MRGVAYWSDRCKDAMEARDSGIFARIACAGPWMYSDAMHNGIRGVVAQWVDREGAAQLESFGTPRTCPDGLVYFPSKKAIAHEDLCKGNCPQGIDYLTSRGVNLTVPLAMAAPRFVSFSTPGIGDPANEFATLAYEVFDNLSGLTVGDPRVIRLICLAISQCYRVTAEMLDDLKWVTSSDIDPMLCCIMGSDPKAEPGEAGQSLSNASG